MISHHFVVLLVSAFTMGIFSGAHCIGMCGGIVCALSYSCQRKPQQSWLPFCYQLAYSFGRILTYSLLGVLTGLLGYVLARRMGSGGVIWIRSFSSALIILAGFYIAGWWQWITVLERGGKLLWQSVSGLTKYFLPVTNFQQAFLLGGLWGLLPCGMVYSALLFSLGAPNAWTAGLLMLAFGLGTMPALLLAGTVMQGYQRMLAAQWVRQLSGITMILLGLFSLWILFFQQASCHCHQ